MTGKAIFSNGTVIKTPQSGNSGLYVDESDKRFKQIDDTGKITDLALAIATDQEYFDKSGDTSASPALIANDYRLNSYNIDYQSAAISEVLTAGGAFYRLLSSIVTPNEVTFGLVPPYKTIADAPQAEYLQSGNGVFLYPSNLYTFNNVYVPYLVKIRLNFDLPVLSSGQAILLMIKLRRQIDDSVISTFDITYRNRNADPNLFNSLEFKTFVSGETDPFVVDGAYLSIESDIQSAKPITLISAGIRTYRDI